MAVLKIKNFFFPFSLVLFFFLSSNSCFSKKTLLINGAGASFPYILYSKWLSEYRKVDPSVAINYQSIGSGGGVRQFITGALDFGGTDIPVSKEDIQDSKKEIIHIPTALGAVAITYNLDFDKTQNLRLTAKALSQIFRGKIKVWNNPELKKLNPHLKLPAQDIVVVYRADGSGTTSFFTDYLSLLSKDFLKEVGKGKSVPWPVGVGGKGNEGVMGLVNKIKGSIGYIGVSYAISQKLAMAAIQNKSGKWTKPGVKSIKSAARQAINKGYMAPLINIKGKQTYPIAGYTYIIISKKLPKKKGPALVKFLKWALNQGQKFSESLYFVSLPSPIVQTALKQLSSIKFEEELK